MSGDFMLFQVAAQHNSWGSPEKGPGYRTTACKFNRINKKRNTRKKKTKRKGMVTFKRS
jgi:hypothetical protein